MKRHKQIAHLIQQNLSEIIQKQGASLYGNILVTVVDVKLTQDLSIARIYLTIYNNPDPDKYIGIKIIELFNSNKSMFRKFLGNRIKNKVRKIPELEFYKDTTLDKVFKIEELLRKDS